MKLGRTSAVWKILMRHLLLCGFSSSFLSPKPQGHQERTSIGALVNMTRHPSIGSITYSLATLFILLSPVTGTGYAFDTASCSPAAIQFLGLTVRRAVTISANTVTVLTGDALRGPSSDIMASINDVMDVTNPVNYIQAVFTGGQVTLPNGQSQQISGIASYTDSLPNFDSSQSPADNGADAQGNVLFFCNSNRLGQARDGLYNNFNTYDGYGVVRGGSVIDHVYYRQPYQQCQQGVVAFLVHSAQGHADRVTICEWVLQPILTRVSQGESWDTRLTINRLRSLLPVSPSNPFSQGLPVELAALIQARNQRIQQNFVGNLPNWNSMRDIDTTVGFDSWLIYILTQTREGGFRTGVGDNAVSRVRGWPTNGWSIASANRMGGHLRSLTYMLVAQVVFSISVGLEFNSAGGFSGFYPPGEAVAPPFDFGRDPFPE